MIRVHRTAASLRDRMQTLYRSPTVRQSAWYSVSTVAVSAVQLVGTVVLTHHISVKGYAEYVFANNLLTFMALFFELGLFYPAAQMMTVQDEDDARVTVGSSINLWLVASAAFSVVVLLLTAGPVQTLFKVQVSTQLRLVAPLAGTWLLAQVVLLLAQGANRLNAYSLTSLLGRIGYVIALAVLVAVGVELTSTIALLLSGAAMLVGFVACLAYLRPRWVGARARTREVVRQTREWGGHVFVGRVLSMGTYRLDVLMLSAFSGSRPLAVYVLATNLTAPLSLPGSSLAAALFARMSHRTQLDARWVAAAAALGAAGTVGLWVIGRPLVSWLFSATYVAAAGLIVPLGIAATLSGVTSLFNRFLGANRRGRELRNTALWLTASNVVLNGVLIPPFGATGAAWASALALAVNLWAHVLPYRRLVLSLEEPAAPAEISR